MSDKLEEDCKDFCDNCGKKKPSFEIRVGRRSYWFCPTCMRLPEVAHYRIQALNRRRVKKASLESTFAPQSYYDRFSPRTAAKSLCVGDFGRDPLGLFDVAK